MRVTLMSDRTRELLPMIVVHCCFCDHVTRGLEAHGPHDDMEQHYSGRHQALIDALVGMVR